MILSAQEYIPLCASRMLSIKGRCASFSDDADGYARGEGCGAIVLKPLSMAVDDGDAIWGVVHGTAVNQDGRTATLTAPNGPAQEEVIKSAHDRAGVAAKEVGYVESHGTGTPLGDPIEAGALAHVFRGRQTPLVVGALKANIGHTEAAAGVAGLIKAVLCLHYGRSPPNIHGEILNPRLAEAMLECPLVFPRESTILEGRYAGVSSFGFGGTNAHVVVGAAPEGSKVPQQSNISWRRFEHNWWENNQSLLIFEDNWKSVSPKFTADVEILYPSDILELHSLLQARMHIQEPLASSLQTTSLQHMCGLLEASVHGGLLQLLLLSKCQRVFLWRWMKGNGDFCKAIGVCGVSRVL